MGKTKSAPYIIIMGLIIWDLEIYYQRSDQSMFRLYKC